MTITVAIPTYNKEAYIQQCLISILNEKKYIDQIIVVDNCSTDKTFEIAKKFQPEILCYQNDTNLGMSRNWNRCIELCTSDWLIIFHGDDEMVPGAISHYRETIEKWPTVGMIHSNAYSITENDESTKKLHETKQKEFWRAGVDAMKCTVSACSAVAVKKEAYIKLGNFLEKSISSDVEMWHRVASVYDVAFLNYPTAIYRINVSSTGLDSLINREVKDIKADWDLLAEKMTEHYPTEESRKQYKEKVWRNSPSSYFAIVKANVRAKNYKKALQALYLILVTYRGLLPLGSIIFNACKKRLFSK